MAETQRSSLAWIAGTFFGIGLLGRGGGTIASIATVGIWAILARSIPSASLTAVTLSAAVLVTFVGIWAAQVMCRECNQNDPAEVVIDEVAGQLLALVAAPSPLNWKYVLASLILFRALDILKPPPISTMEKLHGGAGVMLDDVAAGVITCLVLQLALQLRPGL